MRLTLVLLLIALVLTPTLASGASRTLYEPTAVLPITFGDTTLVTWVPGPVPADKYHVYGLKGDMVIPLATATGTQVEVPSDYDGYAVAGEHNARVSPRATGLVCVDINVGPPPAVHLCGRTPRIPGNILP